MIVDVPETPPQVVDVTEEDEEELHDGIKKIKVNMSSIINMLFIVETKLLVQLQAMYAHNVCQINTIIYTA